MDAITSQIAGSCIFGLISNIILSRDISTIPSLVNGSVVLPTASYKMTFFVNFFWEL